MTKLWNDKRYHSLDYSLKHTYGQKLYKLLLNAGTTCPNRDGSKAFGGCIFCSAQGSGDFAGAAREPIAAQLARQKARLAGKVHVSAYIAYFQPFTGTYGTVAELEPLFLAAIRDPEVKVLSIATRPDCLGPEIMAMLQRLRRIKPVWIELGLQTIHAPTARLINRCFDLADFEAAVKRLRAADIEVITHVILCLPGEDFTAMAATIDYLNHQDIQGLKLQLLHVLRGTRLAEMYARQPFFVPTPAEYYALLGRLLIRLRPDLVIHRLTGDGPQPLLIAPTWTTHKRQVLNDLQAYLKSRQLWQGKEYQTHE